MDAEQIKTLFNMRMAKYPDHACLTQELTFKDEKIAALESENARLKEALRESLKLSGFLSSCARGGEALSEKEEAWITKVGQKAREVLGDD